MLYTGYKSNSPKKVWEEINNEEDFQSVINCIHVGDVHSDCSKGRQSISRRWD